MSVKFVHVVREKERVYFNKTNYTLFIDCESIFCIINVTQYTVYKYYFPWFNNCFQYGWQTMLICFAKPLP